MNDYKPEEIAKRLDKGIPTGPELVKAAECIRGLDELIQMQADRIEELERENAALKRKLCPNSHEGLDWCSCGWRSAKMALREQDDG